MRAGAAVGAALWLALALAAGCSSLLGIENLHGPPDDGQIDSGVPAQISVSGTVRINQPGQPPYSTLVELIRPDGSVAQSAMSGLGDGKFVLTAATGGVALDVALHVVAQVSDAREERMYFAAPLTADRDLATVLVLLDGDVQTLVTSFGDSYALPMTLYIVQVHDAQAMPVAGAMVAPQPSQVIVRYGGGPASGTATTAEGTAYVLDYNTQVTSLSASGAVTVPAHRVRGIPAGVVVSELAP